MDTKIIAHKGLSWRYPENSFSALCGAFEEQGLEVDIRMTKDGVLVIRHDMFMGFTSNSLKLIRNMTLSEIQAIAVKNHKIDRLKHKYMLLRDAKLHDVSGFLEFIMLYETQKLESLAYSESSIMTLEDLLQRLPLDVEAVIEIKGGNEDYPGRGDTFEKTILETITPYNKTKKIKVKGYNSKLLLNLKEANPELNIGLLVDKKVEDAVKCPLDFISLNIETLKKHRDLLKIAERIKYLWTIDTYSAYLLYEELKEYFEEKPAIITDSPNLIRKFMMLRK